MGVVGLSTNSSDLWKNYNSMPSKTTALDRIIEKEKSAQKNNIQQALQQATDSKAIQAKNATGGQLQKLSDARASQMQQSAKSLNELKQFMGKGINFDKYV